MTPIWHVRLGLKNVRPIIKYDTQAAYSLCYARDVLTSEEGLLCRRYSD
jgi:hypothetical protein